MIKVCIFNKSNCVSRFDIFRKFFECINSKRSLTCCTRTDNTDFDIRVRQNGAEVPQCTASGVFIK